MKETRGGERYKLNLRSTAEFNRSVSPFRVLDIFLHLLDTEFEGDDPNWIWVTLSKHGPQSRNFLSSTEIHLFRVHFDVSFDPLVRESFNLVEVGSRDGGFVREIESEFRGCYEGSFLINVIAEYFSQAVVEDVSSGVVVSERPSSELYIDRDPQH